MPSSDNGSRGSGSGAPSALSVTSCVPAVLMNPLSVRATVLRNPELAKVSEPELVEEGDILFDVLANPLHHTPAFFMNDGRKQPLAPRGRSQAERLAVHGIGNELLLPATVGKHFLGQLFRAFLSFHNAATYPLHSVSFRIECRHPSKKSEVLVTHVCPRLERKGNMSFMVELSLLETGQYTLNVVVSCLDVVNETRHLMWSSSFQVERAIAEIRRELHVIPVIKCRKDDASNFLRTAGPTLQDVMLNIALPSKKYVLLFSLQNTSSMPLAIVSVKLHCTEAFEVLPPPRRVSAKHGRPLSPSWWPTSVEPPEGDADAFRMHYAGGGDEPIEDLHMNPRDTRNHIFELLLKPDSLRSLLVRQSSSSHSVAVAPTSLTDIGYVEWKWRCPGGDGGTDRSSVVRIGRLSKQPTLELFVVGVHPERPKAGTMMVLECMVINFDSVRRIDLALRVRPELLVPAIVYTGPLVNPLGLIEARGVMTFRVCLLPWQTGWVTLCGGLELCDARAPTNLLWPIKPATTELPPLSSSASPGATPVVTELQEEPYPPVMCKFLVY